MTQHSFCIHIGQEYLTIASTARKGKLTDTSALALHAMSNNIYSTQTEQDIRSTGLLLKKLMSESGIKEKEANVVIPDAHSYARIVEMPKLTEKELVSAIKYQADQFIPIPIDNVSLDIETIHEDKKSKTFTILLVASANSVVDKVVEIAEAAGLLPVSVESETSASLRLMTEYFTPKKVDTAKTSITLCINFGVSSTSLYLFNRSTNLPLQLNNFAVGLDLFERDVRANFNIDRQKIKEILTTVGLSDDTSKIDMAGIVAAPYTELVSEIERFLVSVQSKYNMQVADALIFGEGSNLRNLDVKLSRSLGFPVSVFNPDEFFVTNNVYNYFKKDIPLFIPAIGGSL